MEPDDLLDTLAYSVHHLEAGPCVVLVPTTTIPTPNPLASPLGGDLGGPPGHTLWSFMHHAIMLSCCCFFFIHVIGWSGGCFNPGLIPGVSLWLLICNTPLGNEPLPKWHPESRVHVNTPALSFWYNLITTLILFLFSESVFGNLWLYCCSVLCVIKKQKVFSLKMLKYSC